jgi:hypothetical protein
MRSSATQRDDYPVLAEDDPELPQLSLFRPPVEIEDSET